MSILAKQSLLSQFDGIPAPAMFHILNGRALDIGVGMGMIF